MTNFAEDVLSMAFKSDDIFSRSLGIEANVSSIFLMALAVFSLSFFLADRMYLMAVVASFVAFCNEAVVFSRAAIFLSRVLRGLPP